MEQELITVENDTLVQLVEDSQLERTKAQKVLDNFTSFFNEASKWEAQVKGLIITDASQMKEMQTARDARLALKDIRVSAEKKKKRMKENILIEGRFIDGIYNAVVAITKPLEAELLEKEEFVERKEEERIEKIRYERESKLQQYEIDTTFFDLTNMPEGAFVQLLSSSKIAYEKKVEEERQIEEERIAKEKAEIEQREKIRQDNERLRKEAVAKELEIKKERAKQEAEREAERKKVAQDQAIQQNKLQTAREEKEVILVEMKAKQEAETKAKAEEKARIIAEEQAREEAEKAAALAPDKVKFLTYCDSLLAVERPSVTQGKILGLMDNIIQAIRTVREDAETL